LHLSNKMIILHTSTRQISATSGEKKDEIDGFTKTSHGDAYRQTAGSGAAQFLCRLEYCRARKNSRALRQSGSHMIQDDTDLDMVVAAYERAYELAA